MDVDVLVVGAGPAGLSAAAELRRLGAGTVLVADREPAPGGIPRHSRHTGYGVRDLRRVMTGPAYAERLASRARMAGAEVLAGTTVTDLEPAAAGGLLAMTTSRRGREEIRARTVLLATGCRERPRAARLVPGDRTEGVMTTGELQQRVYLNGERLPGRAVVVGAEHVSFSAAVTLAHAGADVVALVTDLPHQQSYAAFRLGAALRWRLPVWTSTAVRRITGRGSLAGVEVADLTRGTVRFVPCRTLVFTGDWIPDHELARASGVALDPGTLGPAVDTTLRTSMPGVFAAGNLVHAAETADVAALSGRHAARHMVRALAAPDAALAAQGAALVPVRVAPPLTWISPNTLRIAPSAAVPGPPLGRFTLRSSEFRNLARLTVRQDTRRLALSRPTRLIPGRPVHLHAGWLAQADPSGGPIDVTAAWL